ERLRPVVRRPRALVAAPLLTTLTLTLTAACGGGGGGGEETVAVEASPAALAEVSQATIDAGSARAVIETTVEIADQSVAFTVEGVIDFANGRSQFTLDLGGLLAGIGR